ncbi:MAG TPA: hypothetical protein PLP17_02915, partial [Oligoflexia bacterium]|nr:hypothetical protein [Oligoflexia bacterium]
RHDRMTFRLRFLEMLERKLTWVGTLHQARVVEVKADHALIEVPDFSKWGVLTKNGTPLAPGQILSVQLNGFCSKSMRFSFSETQALTPGS